MRANTLRRLATAITLPALFALPAAAIAAHSDFSPARAEMPAYPAPVNGDPIHSGGATASDTALALDVASALASDRRLDGTTITIAVNNGGVSLSGSAEDIHQAAIAEQRARQVAGVHSVSGTLSPTGG